MKRIVTIALIVAGFAFPAFSQRGSSHGGFAGHGGGFRSGGSGFHGGFSAPSLGRRPGFASGYGGFGRRAYPGRGRFRSSYAPFYPTILPYGYVPWAGWPGYGFADDSGYDDDSQPTQPPAEAPYPPYGAYEMPPGSAPYGAPDGPGPAPNAYGAAGSPSSETPPAVRNAPRPPYRPSSQADTAVASPEPQQTLTLLFKDGRPAQQVRNYILTPKWIYIQDGNRRAIAVDELDVAATAQVNRQAGADFELPAMPR